MRILMILHMPWTRNLGAPRVQFEIAEEFEEMGHCVDKFDINDAFPSSNKLAKFFEPSLFAKKASEFVRKNAARYDVIDAHQANLPFSKDKLNFGGVLAARSSGLGHFYLQYEEEARRQRQARGEREPGTFLGNRLRALSRRLGPTLEDYNQSFKHADLINVPNQDEFEFVTQTLGWHDKTIMLHHGLRQQTFEQFRWSSPPPDKRLQQQRVVFIGGWSERKGSRDFPEILATVLEKAPDTQFLFLGCGISETQLKSSFSPETRARIELVPSYRQEELPQLLSQATLGIFPSYCEGFGWAILEKLAAGLPVVAYNIRGVRDMLGLFDRKMMVSPDDTQGLASQITQILHLNGAEYAALSSKSTEIASQFRGKEIANRLLQCYQSKLDDLAVRQKVAVEVNKW